MGERETQPLYRPLLPRLAVFETNPDLRSHGIIDMADNTSTPDGSNKRFETFAQFYPYYLSEHSSPTCRRLHYLGTGLGFGFLALALWGSAWWLIAVPLVGYFFAWIGHFFVEKNRPATFTYPFWSLLGDYKMFFSWLTGRLPAQLDEAGVPRN